jgi:hypothetical protein
MTKPVIHTQKTQLTSINRKEYLVAGSKAKDHEQIFIEGTERSIILTIGDQNEVILAAFYEHPPRGNNNLEFTTYYKKVK